MYDRWYYTIKERGTTHSLTHTQSVVDSERLLGTSLDLNALGDKALIGLL